MLKQLHTAHVTFHGCIRAHKVAMTLQKTGHPAHFVTAMVSPAHSYSGYESVNIFDPTSYNPTITNTSQLISTIRSLDHKIMVWHVHNEPNWLFRVVKEHTKKPIIFDIHDWTSLREDREPLKYELEEEKFALDNADGFVVPSQGYLKKIRTLTDKPSALVYSKVPSFLFPPISKEKKSGLVYEGGLKGNDPNIIYNYDYRNWADYFKRIPLTNGNKIYCYPASSDEDWGDYPKDICEIFNTQTYPSLLYQLSQHTAGLVGSPNVLGDFNDSMPNKLFEYIAAGIPCIVVNAKESKEYVEARGIGLGVQDETKIETALAELKDNHSLHMHVDRWEYTMDGELPKLLTLYEEVINRCLPSRRVIKQTGNYESVTGAALPIRGGLN